MQLLNSVKFLDHFLRFTLQLNQTQVGIKRMHVVSVPLVETGNSQISLLLLAYFKAFRDRIEILFDILMNKIFLEAAHQSNECLEVLDVSLSEDSFFLIDKGLFNQFADLVLVLEDPLLEVLVLVLRVRSEISHNEFFLQLLIEPSVNHGLAATDVDLSEIFEVANQLILEAAHYILRFRVLG